jgi:hypothetical protein
VYSPDPAIGRVQLFFDRNGDGDTLDRSERSTIAKGPTMPTNLVTGQPNPDVLLLGLYHDPSIACPPPSGCSVDIDNVQVMG